MHRLYNLLTHEQMHVVEQLMRWLPDENSRYVLVDMLVDFAEQVNDALDKFDEYCEANKIESVIDELEDAASELKSTVCEIRKCVREQRESVKKRNTP